MNRIDYNDENYYFGGIQEAPFGNPSLFPLRQEDIDKLAPGEGGTGNVDPEQTEVTYTENGVNVIEPSEGFDGMSSVKVTVEVPNPSVKPEPINITATTNSVYTINAADYNVDGLSSVQILVNVEPPTPTIFYYSDGTTSLSSDQIISQSSYDRNKTLTSVEIGTKATSIGNNAFYACYNLTSVTIPDSVTSIENAAFKNCSKLISVAIPNSVTSIGEEAFYGCGGLTSVTIGNSVTSIGGWAFCGTNELTEIIIPSSVTNIGSRTFAGDGAARVIDITFESTTPISLVDGTEVIDIFGIDGSYSTTPTIHVPEGYETIYATHDAGWELIAQYITGIDLPLTTFYYSDGTSDSVRTLKLTSDSYSDYPYLIGVEIGEGVKIIGDNAFESTDLSSVTIPSSVISIGESAFYISTNEAAEIDITFVSTDPITLIDGDGNVINIFGDSEYATIPTIHVPAGYENTYATHDAGWEALSQYIVRP